MNGESKLSQDDIEFLTKGCSSTGDIWIPIFLALLCFGGFPCADHADISTRLSELEGKVDIIEKIVTG